MTLKSDPPEGVRIVVDEDDISQLEGWVQGPGESCYGVTLALPLIERRAKCPRFGVIVNITSCGQGKRSGSALSWLEHFHIADLYTTSSSCHDSHQA